MINFGGQDTVIPSNKPNLFEFQIVPNKNGEVHPKYIHFYYYKSSIKCIQLEAIKHLDLWN